MERTWTFRPEKLHRKKVPGKIVDFSTIEITSKESRGKVDVTTNDIMFKKIRGNYVDFSTSEIISKKVRGNNVDFWINEIR